MSASAERAFREAYAEAPPTGEELGRKNGSARGVPSMEPWISVDDLAVVLGVSTDWVYEKAASGELPSYKFGGHRRFRVSEVETWASGCARGKITRVPIERKARQ